MNILNSHLNLLILLHYEIRKLFTGRQIGLLVSAVVMECSFLILQHDLELLNDAKMK